MIRRRSLRSYAEAFVALHGSESPERQGELVRGFVRLLARHRLLHRAPEIVEEIDRLLLERAGFLKADVAVAQSEVLDRLPEITQLLSEIVGQPVRVAMTRDSRLLAGFRARVEDLVVDASLAGALGRLRAHLSFR